MIKHLLMRKFLHCEGLQKGTELRRRREESRIEVTRKRRGIKRVTVVSNHILCFIQRSSWSYTKLFSRRGGGGERERAVREAERMKRETDPAGNQFSMFLSRFSTQKTHYIG